MGLVVMVEDLKLVVGGALVGREEETQTGLRCECRIYRTALSAYGKDKR